MPFSVGILGYLILGETLTKIQFVAGFLSIFGCWLVAGLAKNKPDYSSAESAGDEKIGS
jgi:drug/metabolite transporter (DMT)-like permease